MITNSIRCNHYERLRCSSRPVPNSWRIWMHKPRGCFYIISSTGEYLERRLANDISCFLLPYVLVKFPRTHHWIVVSARIILTFHRQRKEIKALSGTEHTSQTSYTRIMILGCADAMITLPINFTGFLIIAFQNKLDFWPGWSSVHSSFDVIPEVSSQVWRSSSLTRISVQWTEWIYVCLSLLFFGLFGCTRDARRRYVRAIWTIMSVFGRKKPAEHELSTVSFNPGPYNTTNGTL